MHKPNGFQFQQFFVAHDRCAMKVNTDGILLGAIADVHQVRSILDLGIGSGLVSLMLAQRSTADCRIIGVELDADAAMQARDNVRQSPWANRIEIVEQDVMQLTLEHSFDLIVSNPPYFPHSLASRSQQRDLARSAVNPHIKWLAVASSYLSPKGKITFILPTDIAETLLSQSHELRLYCTEIWQIHTKEGKAAKRTIVSFSPTPQPQQIKSLTIYQANNRYSAEFSALTRDFYLSMKENRV